MSAADHLVDFDDDLSRVPRTPHPDEIPALVRELVRITGAHARQLRAMRWIVWTVVIAVLVGSLGVIATVAAAAWDLGARMERNESVTMRVERLERVEEAGR